MKRVFIGWMLQHVIATCGVDFLPPLRVPFVKKRWQMTGTYGSLFALLLCALTLLWAWSAGPVMQYVIYAAVTLSVYWLGVVSIPGAEKSLGPRTNHKGETRTRNQDEIVIDEVCGMLIAFSPLLWL